MYKRILDIENRLDDGAFLFGARQTGKSTLIADRFKNAIVYDLLKTDLRSRFERHPELLRQLLQDKPSGTIVVIDEIQKVPALMDEVHWLMVNCGIVFLLCGSSARKLKRSGSNTLGGRAHPMSLFPLVSAEIPDFDVDRAISNGMIPRHYLAENPWRRFKGYVDVYLTEEIKDEGLVRNLDEFRRFLEVAAIMDGEIMNYESVAADCSISARTVREYYLILIDTLLGFEVPAYAKTIRRKVVQSPRFYLFDNGIANYLMGRRILLRGTDDYGHAFEHLVVQEIRAYLNYSESSEKLSYWRTYTGIEVDVVLGDAKVAIEIKSAEQVRTRHCKNLKVFKEEHPDARCMLVSLDKLSRRIGEVECEYVLDFLKALWEGKVI